MWEVSDCGEDAQLVGLGNYRKTICTCRVECLCVGYSRFVQGEVRFGFVALRDAGKEGPEWSSSCKVTDLGNL